MKQFFVIIFMVMLFGCVDINNGIPASNAPNTTNYSLNQSSLQKLVQPDFFVVSPRNASSVYGVFQLDLNVLGFKLVQLGCVALEGEGQAHVFVDNAKQPIIMESHSKNITIHQIGIHTLRIELMDCNYSSLDPKIVKFITIEVVPFPLPNSSFQIISPTDNEKITGKSITVRLATKNISSEQYFFRYSLDSAKPVLFRNVTLQLINLDYGNHTLEIDVVNSIEGPLLPFKKVRFELVPPPPSQQLYIREITLRLHNGGLSCNQVFVRYDELVEFHIYVLEDGSYPDGFRIQSDYFNTIIPRGGYSNFSFIAKKDFVMTTYWNGTSDVRDTLKIYVDK